MKISYSWLKEYIDIKKSPEEIATLLTNGGSEVKAIERIGGDYIMDIEITPNRSDCLSYIGIAREISGLTGKAVKVPLPKVEGKKSSGAAPFTVDIKDKDLCPRYSARLIRDVKVRESPDWLKKKIASMELRPVNNVVDITNYVLFELGQPMHAFDYDRIKGKAIVVRRAHKGEKMTSIDKIERSLESNMLVIADQERPIAIAGVMGSLDTEVRETTKNVLLESAYFDPVSIRKTSSKLTLMSESSYRFERGVDPGMVLPASLRASILIEDICRSKIGEFVDKGTWPEKEKKVSLCVEHLNKLLNLELKESDIKKILSQLFLKTSLPKKGIITVLVPSSRPDIKYEIDLIEEVARIYGYDNIAMTIPRIIPAPERKSIYRKGKEKVSEILNSLGFNEVITYGMLSKGAIQNVFGSYLFEAINIKNYLSADQEVMRPSLIPGILNVLVYNTNRGIKDLKIFEIGAVYSKDSKRGYSERTNLCIALTGLFSSDWQRQKSDVTFFDSKGVLKAVFDKLGLKDFMMTEKLNPPLGEGVSSDILYEGKCIGKAGCLASDIQNKFDLNQKVFLAEIDFDTLVNYINLEKKFSDIPKYPSIKRDISLVAGTDVSFKKIMSLVEEQSGELVEKIELLETYRGKQIPDGQQGMSFRIEYRDKNKTLSTEEVDKIHSAIRKSLAEKLGVTLR